MAVTMLDDFIRGPRIAYFSMEIALRADIPTYAGGLGILAGDTMRSAADLDLPMVAVSLVSRAGYFRQELDANGRQSEVPAVWEPRRFASLLHAKIAVPIEDRDVWVGSWLYILEGQWGGHQPIILLDTDLGENGAQDREITHYLYGGDDRYRLKQEAVLGIGGVRILSALGFHIRQYHLNEGHSALLTLEVLRRHAYPPEDVRPGEPLYDIPRVRARCNFTTHTPVDAGHDQFSYELVSDVLRRIIGTVSPGLPSVGPSDSQSEEHPVDLDTVKRLAGADALNMTRLALNLSDYVNGVANRHAALSQTMFPGYRVHAITNGVHPFTWTCESFRSLYDRYLPAWCHEPEQLNRADCCIPDAELWQAHVQAKGKLIGMVKELTSVSLDPEVPILGFARRMTAYKRPDLIFADLERLKEIARRFPFQIVMGGKAHPRDLEGKALIERLHAHGRALADSIPVVFLPDYDLALAQLLVAGADLWLNTPLAPYEASGTSGMKAAFNGVPSLSVLDGWWIEGCIEGVTGWAIGDKERDARSAAAQVYDMLERVVLPLFRLQENGRRAWLHVMKGAISKNASFFNSHRMMRRYVTEAYL
jgi:starch phosphorylase